MSEMKFKLAAGTNVGLIRQNNEDNFVVCPDLSNPQWIIPQDGDYADLGPYGALLVVADGMGGANAGEVASAIAVQTIQEMFVPETLKGVVGDEKAIQRFMVEVVKAADLNIVHRSTIDRSTQGMGTTVVMAWVLGTRAYVCWCGDSRCYALSERNGLVQVSKDHSYVQELVDKGELAAEYMHDHPLSNVITRCLGDVDKRAQPETRVYELYDGDTILLCSDGLCGLVYDADIAAVLSHFNEDLMECKNELISAALSHGGHDNVTVALCTVRMGDTTIRPRRTTPSAANTVSEELRTTVIPYKKEDKTKDEAQTKEEPETHAPAKKAAVPEPKQEQGATNEAKAEKERSSQKEEQSAAQQETTDEKAAQAEGETREAKEKTAAPKEETVKEAADTGELQKTAKTDKGKKKKTSTIIILLMLLAVVAIVACVLLVPECKQAFQNLVETVQQNLSNR